MQSNTGSPLLSRITPPCSSRAQSWSSAWTNSCAKPARFVIGVVVVLFQADADRLAAGFLPKERHRRANQVFLSLALIHQAEESRCDLAFFFGPIVCGDVAGDVHRADEPALRIEAGSRADQKMAAQARLAQLGTMFLAVLAGLPMRAERGRLCRSVHSLVAVQPHTLLGRHTQPLGHGLIGANDAVLIVQDGHQIRDGVEGLLPFFLGLSPGGDLGLQGLVGCHQLVGPLLLGDVDDGRTAASSLPLAVRGGDALDQHDHGLPVAEELDLAGLLGVGGQHLFAEIGKRGAVFHGHELPEPLLDRRPSGSGPAGRPRPG